MKRSLLTILITGLALAIFAPMTQAGSIPIPFSLDSVNVELNCDELSMSWSHHEGFATFIIYGALDGTPGFRIFEGSSGSFSTNLRPRLRPSMPFAIIIAVLDEEGNPLAGAFLELNCTPTTEDERTEAESACGDGRLSYTLCQPLAVYPVVSDDGIGLTIYLVSRGSDIGQFMLYIPAETFNELPDTLAENCTIASSEDGRVVVYLLTSGQIQINVGPDEEGKVFAYIFNDLQSAPVSIDSYISGETPEILPACL